MMLHTVFFQCFYIVIFWDVRVAQAAPVLIPDSSSLAPIRPINTTHRIRISKTYIGARAGIPAHPRTGIYKTYLHTVHE